MATKDGVQSVLIPEYTNNLLSQIIADMKLKNETIAGEKPTKSSFLEMVIMREYINKYGSLPNIEEDDINVDDIVDENYIDLDDNS